MPKSTPADRPALYDGRARVDLYTSADAPYAYACRYPEDPQHPGRAVVEAGTFVLHFCSTDDVTLWIDALTKARDLLEEISHL